MTVLASDLESPFAPAAPGLNLGGCCISGRPSRARSVVCHLGEKSFVVRRRLLPGLPAQAVEAKKTGYIDPILTRSAAGLAGRCEKRGLWPDFEEESHVRRRTDGERQSRHR